MGSSETAEVITRVIHHLDREGRVIRIEWEPSHAAGERRTAIVQINELLYRAGVLLHTLATLEAPDHLGGDRRHGYRQAVEEIRMLPALDDLRNAMGDVRPYLASIRGGLRFPSNAPAAQPMPRRNWRAG